MLQTLYVIPSQIGGIPVFGFGWALGLWLLASAVVLVYLVRRYGFGLEARSYLGTLLVGAAVIAFLLPRLMDESGLPIRGYGVMLLIAVTSAVGLSIIRAKQVGLDPEIILSLAMWLFVSGIVGARLFYIIEYWDKFQKPTIGQSLAAMINITQGGLVVYGSLLAGGAALAFYVYRYKLPGLAMSDLAAPSVVLGMALGRVGCFFNGCCYGGECELPWAVQFPIGSPPFIDQAQDNKLPIHGLLLAKTANAAPTIESVEADSLAAKSGLRAGETIVAVNGIEVRNVEDARYALMRVERPGVELSVLTSDSTTPKQWTLPSPAERSRAIHPAQLYSTVDALLLCLFLLAYSPYKKRDGELTALTLTIHPISRYLLEIIRIDEKAVFNTGLSISQNVSLLILVGAVICWIIVLSRKPGTYWPAGVDAPLAHA